MGGKWKQYQLSPLDRRILKNKIKSMNREMNKKVRKKSKGGKK